MFSCSLHFIETLKYKQCFLSPYQTRDWY